jgi:2-amino-4-hydroxy-6-hydroxymethyldihydropteridine diphosphokinase
MRGIEALVSPETRIRTRSRLWQTPCMPVGAGPDYINAVVMLETTLEPQGLLDVLHRLEAAFDRARTGRWAARTLDLDLIDHDGAILPDSQTQAQWRALPPERQPIDAPDRLILPHPRLQDRGFVLIPLAEAAPVWHDPVSGRSVHDLIAALPAGVCDGMAPMPCRDGLSSVLP